MYFSNVLHFINEAPVIFTKKCGWTAWWKSILWSFKGNDIFKADPSQSENDMCLDREHFLPRNLGRTKCRQPSCKRWNDLQHLKACGWFGSMFLSTVLFKEDSWSLLSYMDRMLETILDSKISKQLWRRKHLAKTSDSWGPWHARHHGAAGPAFWGNSKHVVWKHLWKKQLANLVDYVTLCLISKHPYHIPTPPAKMFPESTVGEDW